MIARYHLVGIAGVGMSALAEFLLDQGVQVSGSDRFLDQGQDVGVLACLRRQDVDLFAQDGAGVDADVDVVVVSSAIEEDNPDLVKARELGVQVQHRAEVLAEFSADHPTVLVTGTAGKTTLTGMIGWMLQELGADPTVINGGAVLSWASEGRVGSGRCGSGVWVMEGDESDKSILRFHPSWAVVSNISKDHFELDEVQAMFKQFVGQVSETVIAGPGVCGQIGSHDHVVEDQIEFIRGSGGTYFDYKGVKVNVPLPGLYNAENAFLAIRMVERLGYDVEAAAEALQSFTGIHRRLEKVGEVGNVTVLDDYAHNPAKLAAVLGAVAENFGRTVAIWRPHGFAPMRMMWDELLASFEGVMRAQDELFVLPIFFAGGTAAQDVSSTDFVAALSARGVSAHAVADYETLSVCLDGELRSGDACVILGARDPELPVFARHVVNQLKMRDIL